jgi:hypothetical protein
LTCGIFKVIAGPTLNWIGKEAVVNHHLQVPFHLAENVEIVPATDLADNDISPFGEKV